jgi:DNA-binding MarR family transcriptional regulator/N-acetylglutamate synthase-like GNAT family acetyltransferase
MTEALQQRVEAIRRFNRFYTQKIGVLEEGLLHSPFTLGEVRVLYELAHREQPTATELANELGLDAGQLSRMLRGFEKSKLIARKPSPADGRQSLLTLTEPGRRTFAPLNERAKEEIVALLKSISVSEQNRLVEAMHAIEALLGRVVAEPGKPAYILRPHQPGDMGWVVHRHGVLYAQEYGWDERFEALVADIVAEFIQNFDPRRERCWIAERAGEIVGSVFLVQKSKTVAKLRLLLVEPSARGLGIGARLVDECVRFARQAGYRSLTLWTQSVLSAARHIYQKAGFRLVRKQRHNSFGYDLLGETWELKLRPSR